MSVFIEYRLIVRCAKSNANWMLHTVAKKTPRLAEKMKVSTYRNLTVAVRDALSSELDEEDEEEAPYCVVCEKGFKTW